MIRSSIGVFRQQVGNDVTWRAVLDLNRILYYADANGNVHGKLACRAGASGICR